MSSRRSSLSRESVMSTTNPGLWLDRFISNQDREDRESRSNLIKQVAEIPTPKEYLLWFKNWENTLQEYGAICRKGHVKGRMVVGLGEESVLETSITLHRIYGVPYIPGKALKGVTASFAHQYLDTNWERGSSAYDTLFGSEREAGYVVFLDALPLPNKYRLYPDIMTVHHREYYQNEPDTPPADWDDPNPIPFLSAVGNFLIPLAGPPDWVETTFEIMEEALLHLGVGAKTSSGYGRLQLDTIVREPKLDSEEKLIKEIESLRVNEVAGSINTYYQKWKELEGSQDRKKRVAEAIIDKVKEAKREKKSRKKRWYKDLKDFLKNIS